MCGLRGRLQLRPPDRGAAARTASVARLSSPLPTRSRRSSSNEIPHAPGAGGTKRLKNDKLDMESAEPAASGHPSDVLMASPLACFQVVRVCCLPFLLESQLHPSVRIASTHVHDAKRSAAARPLQQWSACERTQGILSSHTLIR